MDSEFINTCNVKKQELRVHTNSLDYGFSFFIQVVNFLYKKLMDNTSIDKVNRYFANINLVTLIITFFLMCFFLIENTLQLCYTLPFVESISFSGNLLGVLFFFLSNLILFLISNLYYNQSWKCAFYSICLFGVFFSTNFLIFFVAVELLVLPTIFISSLRYVGSTFPKAIKMLLFFSFLTMLIFLLASLFIYYTYTTFDLRIILQNVYNKPEFVKFLCFYIMLIGLSMKLSLFPLHVWLPKAHVEGDTEMSLILASILLKCLYFGLFRFCFLPFSTGLDMQFFRYICFVGIIFPVLLCLRDFNLKRIIAYNSISHMSIGCLTLSYYNSLINEDFVSSLVLSGFIVMVSHSFVASLLFLLVGYIQNIYKTKHFINFTYINNNFLFNVLFFLCFLDNAGCLPLTMSFIGEFNILIHLFTVGSFHDLFIIFLYLFISCILTFYVILRIRSTKVNANNNTIDFGKASNFELVFLFSLYIFFSFFYSFSVFNAVNYLDLSVYKTFIL